MARTLSIQVSDAYAAMRLDSFLFEAGAYPSRSKAVRQIEAGKVFVNGAHPTKKTIVYPQDFIVYEELAEETLLVVAPEPINLSVVYEDDDLLVINKQAGLVCHPSVGHPAGTLCNALVHYLGETHLSHIQGADRPGIVHRLDGDTSGLMLCAKKDDIGYELQDEIRRRVVNRRYLCLVHGNIASDTGLIDAPIFRSDKNRLRMEVSDKPQARSSVTTFRVLERFEAGLKDNGFTLIECKLYSGRTHQIRVHMEYIKHWCVGDQTYGTPGKSDNLGLGRQFLHSYYLAFVHPHSQEDLDFLACLPNDLQSTLTKLHTRSMGLTDAGREVLAQYAPVALCQAEGLEGFQTGRLKAFVSDVPASIREQAAAVDSFAATCLLAQA